MHRFTRSRPGSAGTRHRAPLLTAVVAVSCSLLAGGGVAVVSTATATATATAAVSAPSRIVPPPPGPYPTELIDDHTERWVVPEYTETDLADYSRAIATCIAGDRNTGCVLTQTASAGYTVDHDFGVTSDLLTATIGISRSQTLSFGVNCSNTPSPAGTKYVAYGLFDRHHFHVMEASGRDVWQKHHSMFFPSGAPPETTGYTSTYPSTHYDVPKAGFRCRVEQE